MSARKATHTTALNLIRVGELLIPLLIVGMRVGGIRGIFAGRLLTDLTVGALGLFWVERVLAIMSTANPAFPPEGAGPRSH
ncbi:MAG: hypothetical protein OZSIB_1750 [Candidatus Ozemobacter sibiricus]|uniref:Uncharacterized protein n=1 Tax=Candidatus Ozemobacter sibiricus TaxID=2268124 RepID=A0A367ZL48_9BACT|nr:MAG: hypothetical protein OZSIB_1750 [Candidatus Ozemobacter sibiricus]